MPRRMERITVSVANAADSRAIAAVRTAAAERLTREHGRGHWSSHVTERAARRVIETSRVLIARSGRRVAGTVRLDAKKPWAIDPSYFTSVPRPIYLHDLAVEPDAQGRGVGTALLEAAKEAAKSWPADALRLDAYDAAAGAGRFYAKSGFREVGRVTYRNTPLIYFELLF